jgi:hypothetical protein
MKKRKPAGKKAQQRNPFPPGLKRISVDNALSGSAALFSKMAKKKTCNANEKSTVGTVIAAANRARMNGLKCEERQALLLRGLQLIKRKSQPNAPAPRSPSSSS